MRHILILIILLIPIYAESKIEIDYNGAYTVTSTTASKDYGFIGSVDGNIRAVNPRTSEVEYILSGHNKEIISMDIDNNNKFLISASKDDIIIIWDLDAKKEIKRIKKTGMGVRAVAINEDCSYIYIAFPAAIYEYDMKSWTNTNIFEGYKNSIYSIALNTKGNILATGSKTGEIYITDIKENEIKSIIKSGKELIISLDFARDKDVLISGSYDKTARIYEISGNYEKYYKLIKEFSLSNDTLRGVAANSSGSKFILASDDGSVILYNLENGVSLSCYIEEDKGEVTSVSANDDFNFVIYGKGAGFEEEHYGVIYYIGLNQIYRKIYSFSDSDIVISQDKYLSARGGYSDKISSYKHGNKETAAQITEKYFKKDRMEVEF